MRLAIVIGFEIVCAICLSAAANAQSAPSLPEQPTQQKCDDFKTQYMNYLKSLRDAANDCDAQNDHEATFGKWVPLACGAVQGPQVCANQIEQSACAANRAGPLFNECYQLANAAQKAKDAIADTAEGTLDETKRRLMEIGKKVEKIKTEYEELKSLRDGFVNYNNLSTDQKLDFHKQLAQWLNEHGNSSPLSRALTDLALQRTTEIDENALGQLDEQLKYFDEEQDLLSRLGPADRKAADADQVDLAAENELKQEEQDNIDSQKKAQARRYLEEQKRRAQQRHKGARRTASQATSGNRHRYSSLQCRQLLAQIQQYRNVLPAYQARGYGGIILRRIEVNQAAYNRGCN